jgi:hypothetical protein
MTINLSSYAQTTSPLPRDTIIRPCCGKWDTVTVADCGGKFFLFLSEKGLETNERCNDCFGLYVKKTKIDYWICSSCTCRTDDEHGPTISKNGKLVGYGELEQVQQLILQNPDALKKVTRKKSSKRGNKGDITYII